MTIDTELSIKLPQNSNAILATENLKVKKFKKLLLQPTVKKRLWITLLNESCFEKYNINKGGVIGYFIIKPDNIKKHNETKEKNLEAEDEISK